MPLTDIKVKNAKPADFQQPNFQKTQTDNSLIKAFSLVEISIVILIVGILISGVSFGLDLYNNFKATNAKNLTLKSRLNRMNDLLMWYETTQESSYLATPQDGQLITGLKNLSPFSFNQNNALSYQNAGPTFIKSGINALPSLNFIRSQTASNSNSCLEIPNIADNNTETYTYFFVYSPNDDTSNYWSMLEKFQSNNQYPYFLRSAWGGVYKIYSAIYRDATNGVNSGIHSSVVKSKNTLHMVTVRRLARSNIAMWINGGNYLAQFYDGSIDTRSNAKIYIGCREGINNMNADFGEFIFFDRAISETERIDIEKYLSKKWGISYSN